MEVLAAAIVVLAVAALVIGDLLPASPTRPVEPSPRATPTPMSAPAEVVGPVVIAEPEPLPEPEAIPASEPEAKPAPAPARARPAVDAIPLFSPVPPPPPRPVTRPGGSVLGALGPTEVDRRPPASRRTASALVLAVVTLVIAGGVGGVIYLGLSRLG